MENKRIYLDTSVPSAYFDDRWPDRQEMTKTFWKKIGIFESLISVITQAEIDRMEMKYPERYKLVKTLTTGMEVLRETEESKTLAVLYLRHGIIPADHLEDAQHLAIATHNAVDYLVSWNFQHLVNVKTKEKVRALNTLYGYPVVEIVSPPELSQEE